MAFLVTAYAHKGENLSFETTTSYHKPIRFGSKLNFSGPYTSFKAVQFAKHSQSGVSINLRNKELALDLVGPMFSK